MISAPSFFTLSEKPPNNFSVTRNLSQIFFPPDFDELYLSELLQEFILLFHVWCKTYYFAFLPRYTVPTMYIFYRALKVMEDKSLMAELKEIYLKIFPQNSSLIALPDEHSNGQPILALSTISVRSKNDELPACVS